MATLFIDPEVEQQLRDRLASGDRRGAVESALRGYGKQVLALITAEVRDASLADDLYQHFCEVTFRDIVGYRAEGSFCGWARTVATRIVVRSLKTRRGSKEQLVGAVEDLPASASEGQAADQEESTHPYGRAAVRARVSSMVGGLAESDRRIVMLRLVEGCSWAEVAERLHPDRVLPQRQMQTLAATLRQRFTRLLKTIREKWHADAQGRINGLFDELPPLERRLLKLSLWEGHPLDEIRKIIQEEYPEQNQGQLRQNMQAALAHFEKHWREQGLLTREMVKARLISSAALAPGGPAPDRRAH